MIHRDILGHVALVASTWTTELILLSFANATHLTTGVHVEI